MPNFLDYVRENDLGDYAMVALSFKDNTPAGGYGQMINQNASDYKFERDLGGSE